MKTLENQLDDVAACAREIREKLTSLLTCQNGRVHFRPTGSGITMVSLLPECAQSGEGGYTYKKLLENFEEEFRKHCTKLPGKPIPEKQLQSYLISYAYTHGGELDCLTPNTNSKDNEDALYFVTDELALTDDTGKTGCDILALRRKNGQNIPVLIELKSKRLKKKVVSQLEKYAPYIQNYQRQFEAIYSAVLGEDIHFACSPEKWLVWPSLGECTEYDPWEAELRKKGIGVIQYSGVPEAYIFYDGLRP